MSASRKVPRRQEIYVHQHHADPLTCEEARLLLEEVGVAMVEKSPNGDVWIWVLHYDGTVSCIPPAAALTCQQAWEQVRWCIETYLDAVRQGCVEPVFCI